MFCFVFVGYYFCFVDLRCLFVMLFGVFSFYITMKRRCIFLFVFALFNEEIMFLSCSIFCVICCSMCCAVDPVFFCWTPYFRIIGFYHFLCSTLRFFLQPAMFFLCVRNCVFGCCAKLQNNPKQKQRNKHIFWWFGGKLTMLSTVQICCTPFSLLAINVA